MRLSGARKQTGGAAAEAEVDTVDQPDAPETPGHRVMAAQEGDTFLPEAERIANQLEALAKLLVLLQESETPVPEHAPPPPEPRLAVGPEPEPSSESAPVFPKADPGSKPAKEKKRGRLG